MPLTASAARKLPLAGIQKDGDGGRVLRAGRGWPQVPGRVGAWSARRCVESGRYVSTPETVPQQLCYYILFYSAYV